MKELSTERMIRIQATYKKDKVFSFFMKSKAIFFFSFLSVKFNETD